MISVPRVVTGHHGDVTPPNTRSFVIPINWRSHSAQLACASTDDLSLD